METLANGYTWFLPEEIRPPMWRRVALVGVSVFYGAFVVLWQRGLA